MKRRRKRIPVKGRCDEGMICNECRQTLAVEALEETTSFLAERLFEFEPDCTISFDFEFRDNEFKAVRSYPLRVNREPLNLPRH
jgi:hypothetical protein